jgi:signal transduction histidine kinase
VTDTVLAHPSCRVSPDEPGRLAALAAYDLVDGAPEPDLQLIARLAADVCGTSRAVVNIVDADHQYQVAAVGMAPTVCDRGDSMCTVTIAEPVPVVLTDARTDPRFADNHHVNGTLDAIRLYAASQLRVGGGHVIGTLCVLDTQPGELTPTQRAGLDRLARMVVDVLELRRHATLVTEVLHDRERALRELQDARRDLVRSHTDLRQFAGQVSHDLKNPLTGLLGLIATLEDIPTVSGNPDVKRMLDRALSSGIRMWRMIEDVLDYAALHGRPDFGPVDLGDIAAQVVEDLECRITEAGTEVEVGTLPVVMGSPTQLRALVQNLIGNAVKDRHPHRVGRIWIGAQTRSGMHLISVVDNGPGITSADHDQATDGFTRAPADVDGAGIGMATCQRIAAAHHGTLSERDTPGGGTTVTVTLPVHMPGEQVEASGQAGR